MSLDKEPEAPGSLSKGEDKLDLGLSWSQIQLRTAASANTYIPAL